MQNSAANRSESFHGEEEQIKSWMDTRNFKSWMDTRNLVLQKSAPNDLSPSMIRGNVQTVQYRNAFELA